MFGDDGLEPVPLNSHIRSLCMDPWGEWDGHIEDEDSDSDSDEEPWLYESEHDSWLDDAIAHSSDSAEDYWGYESEEGFTDSTDEDEESDQDGEEDEGDDNSGWETAEEEDLSEA